MQLESELRDMKSKIRELEKEIKRAEKDKEKAEARAEAAENAVTEASMKVWSALAVYNTGSAFKLVLMGFSQAGPCRGSSGCIRA